MKFAKGLLLVLAILSVTFTSDLHAQKMIRAFHQAITADPISLAFGVLNARYEDQINPENSFTILGQYYSFGDWTAVGIGGSFRWYLLQEDTKAIKGFSFGPAIAIQAWSSSYSSDYNGTIVSIGAEAAYKFVIDAGFAIEPNLVILYGTSKLTGLEYRTVSLGVSLGYAWP